MKEDKIAVDGGFVCYVRTLLTNSARVESDLLESQCARKGYTESYESEEVMVY